MLRSAILFSVSLVLAGCAAAPPARTTTARPEPPPAPRSELGWRAIAGSGVSLRGVDDFAPVPGLTALERDGVRILVLEADAPYGPAFVRGLEHGLGTWAVADRDTASFDGRPATVLAVLSEITGQAGMIVISGTSRRAVSIIVAWTEEGDATRRAVESVLGARWAEQPRLRNFEHVFDVGPVGPAWERVDMGGTRAYRLHGQAVALFVLPIESADPEGTVQAACAGDPTTIPSVAVVEPGATREALVVDGGSACEIVGRMTRGDGTPAIAYRLLVAIPGHVVMIWADADPEHARTALPELRELARSAHRTR